MTEEEAATWPAWRLVMEGKATLEELETHYSIVDVEIANRFLDSWQAAQAKLNHRK